MYNIKNLDSIAENNHNRITTLFDAITAIAMTMMALEISVAGIQSFDVNALLLLFNEITIYLISFIAFGSIWVTHAILYSSSKSLGSLGYLLLNIMLMFIITIYPILTKLMSEFRQNSLLQCVYIGCFLIMEIIMVIFIHSGKRHELNDRKAQLEKVRYFIELKKEFQQEPSVELNDIQNKLMLAEKYFFNKEISKNLFQELLLSLPEQIQIQYQRQEVSKKISYVKAICFLVIIFFVVTVSVIILIKNPMWCYIIMIFGGFISIVGNFTINIYYRRKGLS
ncbi:TMEM175 family protein [Eubacteriaceae bacterium ES2]|nr:TMEM175 family protein [Eubacteriaceae bacterium ES2]